MRSPRSPTAQVNSRRWRSSFAYETARDATHHSLHIHGGYGFGMEQDIQLYYRRAARLGDGVRRARRWSSTASPKCDMARSEHGLSARVDMTAKLRVARAASRSRPTSVTSTSHHD